MILVSFHQYKPDCLAIVLQLLNSIFAPPIKSSMFYPLKVKEIRKETEDCVSIAFDLTDSQKEDFHYVQGQYLTLKQDINGEEVRRSYSLCSSPHADDELRVAVKKVENGKFSTYANESLQEGDTIEAMKPMGNFYPALDAQNQKHYVLLAAGSGITPIFGIIKSILQVEPKSRIELFYGNKSSEDVIFKAMLDDLASANEQLNIHYIYSRESIGDPLFEGHISASKLDAFTQKTEGLYSADGYFICGPEKMIFDLKDHLEGLGINPSKVHFELFTSVTAPEKEQKAETSASAGGASQVTVIMDDEEFNFELEEDGDVILDAAIDAGVDAPYSCKGAVCCTCKAKVIEGEVEMDMNYALSDDEVDEGFILTCQSHPKSPKVIIDYDQL